MTEEQAMNAWVQFAAAALTGLMTNRAITADVPERASKIAAGLLDQMRLAELNGEFLPYSGAPDHVET